MQTARLNDWFLVNGKVLAGVVSGHPKLADGEVITSRVRVIDLVANRAITQNTLYTLGEPRKVSF